MIMNKAIGMITLFAFFVFGAPSPQAVLQPWKCPDYLFCSGGLKRVTFRQETTNAANCYSGAGNPFGCQVGSSGINCWGGCTFPAVNTGVALIRCPSTIKCAGKSQRVNYRLEGSSGAVCVADFPTNLKACSIGAAGTKPVCSTGCSLA